MKKVITYLFLLIIPLLSYYSVYIRPEKSNKESVCPGDTLRYSCSHVNYLNRELRDIRLKVSVTYPESRTLSIIYDINSSLNEIENIGMYTYTLLVVQTKTFIQISITLTVPVFSGISNTVIECSLESSHPGARSDVLNVNKPTKEGRCVHYDQQKLITNTNSIIVVPAPPTNVRISRRYNVQPSRIITLEWDIPSKAAILADYYQVEIVPKTSQKFPRILAPILNVTIQPFFLYNITIYSANCIGRVPTVIEIGKIRSDESFTILRLLLCRV